MHAMKHVYLMLYRGIFLHILSIRVNVMSAQNYMTKHNALLFAR